MNAVSTFIARLVVAVVFDVADPLIQWLRREG